MDRIVRDRRGNRRYDIHLPLQYRVSQKGMLPTVGSGMTRDMSTNGLNFRCRRPLPVGAHIELTVEWPARYGELYPIDLQLTGFVVRSESGRAAVRITSRRFRVLEAAAETYRASA